MVGILLLWRLKNELFCQTMPLRFTLLMGDRLLTGSEINDASRYGWIAYGTAMEM
jgi:hypothetical protein